MYKRQELILREGQQLGGLDVHLLSFKHVNQLHLLLEGLQQFIPLSFKLPVLIDESVLISPRSLILTSLVHFRLTER